MKRFKITDGIVKKVEKTLLKIAKNEYSADGLYVAVDGIEITSWEEYDFSIEYKVRWGRMADGKCDFQHEATIWSRDGKLDFLAGQFYEKILTANGNE